MERKRHERQFCFLKKPFRFHPLYFEVQNTTDPQRNWTRTRTRERTRTRARARTRKRRRTKGIYGECDKDQTIGACGNSKGKSVSEATDDECSTPSRGAVSITEAT